MKNIPSYFLVIFIGLFLILILVLYFKFDIKQSEQTQVLNEIVATHINQNIDLGNARVNGEVFLDKNSFEQEVKASVQEKYESATIKFDYLEKSNKALKALKVSMTVGEKTFTSTYKVNEV